MVKEMPDFGPGLGWGCRLGWIVYSSVLVDFRMMHACFLCFRKNPTINHTGAKNSCS